MPAQEHTINLHWNPVTQINLPTTDPFTTTHALTCAICGVLVWNVELHYNHTHPTINLTTGTAT